VVHSKENTKETIWIRVLQDVLHIHVTDGVKFITKTKFYTDKVASHIAICRYLVIIQYKPTKYNFSKLIF